MSIFNKILFLLPVFLNAQINPVCFQQPTFVTTPTAGTYPHSICSADFNSDGKKDLVVVNAGSNDVSVLLGDGVGNFAKLYDFSAGTFPRSVCSGDFNLDGKPDLAVSGQDVHIFLGTGNPTATFLVGTVYMQDSYPFSIITADFNQDNRPDIATANVDSSNISVRMGIGDGTFSSVAEYPIGPVPRALCAGDFNNDGKIDIVAANYDFGFRNASVLYNNGTGAFAPAVSYSVNVVPLAPEAADFNNDGFDDLAIIGFGTIDVLMYTGANTFSLVANLPSSSGGPCEIASGDFNGDGNMDLASCNYSNKTTNVYAGLGNGLFLAPVIYSVNQGPLQILSADVNADNKTDLAVINYNGHNISVLLNERIDLQINAPPFICVNTPAKVNVTGAQSYSWSSGSTSNSFSVIPVGSASYTVTGINSIGCSSTSSFTIQAVTCTNTDEVFENNKILISPNPTTGLFHLSKKISSSVELTLFNMSANVILNFTLSKFETEISLSGQPEGVYFLMSRTPEGSVETYKIVKLD